MTDKEKIRAYIMARMDDQQAAVEEFDRLGAKEAAAIHRSLLGNNAAIISFIDSMKGDSVSETYEYRQQNAKEFYERTLAKIGKEYNERGVFSPDYHKI